MSLLIDANLTARGNTDASEPFRSSQDVAYDLETSKRALYVKIPRTSRSHTFAPSSADRLESAGSWVDASSSHDWHEHREALANAWASLHRKSWVSAEPLKRLTRATSPTSTTVSSVAMLLRRHLRDERLRRMPKAARAAYERIRDLREEIGPVDFDIVRALRELRDDG